MISRNFLNGSNRANVGFPQSELGIFPYTPEKNPVYSILCQLT